MGSNKIEQKVKLYRPLLLEASLKPAELIKSLSFINEDEKMRVLREKKLEGSGKATALLLDIIESRRDVKGRWNHFVGVLENNDFDYVASSLSSDYVDESPGMKKLIKTFSRPIAYRVNPTQLVPSLRKRELITRQDGDEIEAEHKCNGSVAAFIVLLDRIPRRRSTWYDVFLGILVDNRYGEIVNEVDEDFMTGRYGLIFSGNDNVYERTVTVPRSENPPFARIQTNRREETVATTCKQVEIIDFSTCIPPQRTGTSGHSSVPNLTSSSFSSSSLKSPNVSTSLSEKNCSHAGQTTSRSSHVSRQYQNSITITDLQKALIEIGYPLSTCSRKENEGKRKGRSSRNEENSAESSCQSEMMTQAIDMDQTIRKIPLTEPTDLTRPAESYPHSHSAFSVASSASEQNGKENNRTENSFFSTTDVKIQNSDSSMFSLLQDTDRKSSSSPDMNYSGNVSRMGDSIANNFEERERSISPIRNQCRTGENSRGYQDGPVILSPGILYQRNEAVTRVGENGASYNNLQRMYMMSEEQLRRKRRQIQEERHQVKPVCDGFNIDDESVVDNVNYQEESSDDDDDDDEIHQQVKVIKLRGYQEELVAPGIKGRNCMVVAPTGSGKTLVAIKVIQEHFKRMELARNPKVVFLVEQSQLAEQQYKVCEEYFGEKAKVITGEVQRKENYQEVAGWLQRRDILVMTAQLLVNALKSEDVNIMQFTLLVFDECHHTNLNHAFNQIMHAYLKLKLDVPHVDGRRHRVMPQVIGLTASVGVGKAGTKEKAVEWIKKMMAHLDAQEIVTVQHNIHELRNCAKPAEQKTQKTRRRESNIFGDVVSWDLMDVVEKKMAESHYVKQIPGYMSVLKIPRVRGCDPYTQWLSNLKKQSAALEDDEARRFIVACHKYLEIYNKALIIYADARVKDALSFLEDEISQINEHARKDETDIWLETHFGDFRNLLNVCQYSKEQKNPKLEALLKILTTQFRKRSDSRCIIFVKTRDLVNAIHRWMMETPDLSGLGPVPFVGVQASVQQGGMTRHEQVDVLQYFRDGKHKVIIATSVAEEGLDIQKCNLVIRYDYVTNEIAMVQARGRGRADDSKYILLTEEGGRAARKEEINLIKEKMMDVAISKLQQKLQTNRHEVLMEILEIQRNEFLKRDMAETKLMEKINQAILFELLCGKCSALICQGSDVKLIMDAHHAVINPEIKERVTAKRVNRAKFSNHIIQCAVGKIFCSQCGHDLGNISIYNQAQYPVIKIENLLIYDITENVRITAKAWKKAPFAVGQLSADDQRTWINSDASNILPF